MSRDTGTSAWAPQEHQTQNPSQNRKSINQSTHFMSLLLSSDSAESFPFFVLFCFIQTLKTVRSGSNLFVIYFILSVPRFMKCYHMDMDWIYFHKRVCLLSGSVQLQAPHFLSFRAPFFYQHVFVRKVLSETLFLCFFISERWATFVIEFLSGGFHLAPTSDQGGRNPRQLVTGLIGCCVPDTSAAARIHPSALSRSTESPSQMLLWCRKILFSNWAASEGGDAAETRTALQVYDGVKGFSFWCYISSPKL